MERTSARSVESAGADGPDWLRKNVLIPAKACMFLPGLLEAITIGKSEPAVPARSVADLRIGCPSVWPGFWQSFSVCA